MPCKKCEKRRKAMIVKKERMLEKRQRARAALLGAVISASEVVSKLTGSEINGEEDEDGQRIRETDS